MSNNNSYCIACIQIDKISACNSTFCLIPAPHFDHGKTMGHVSSHTVREESGLCASRRHTDILYTHNDSGDSARFFAIDANTGRLNATLTVTGATSHDWEDIACGELLHLFRTPGCGLCMIKIRFIDPLA